MKMYEKGNVVYQAQPDSDFEQWLLDNDFKEAGSSEEDKPLEKMSKEELVAKAEERGIALDAKATKAELVAFLSDQLGA